MSDSKTPVTHDLSKLFEKIKDVRICMFSTTDAHGTMHSRPMYTQKPEADGSLLFFTDKESAKVYEVQKDSQVNLSFANPDDNVYASVSGRCNAFRDQGKINELWSEPLRAWFPQGKEDPSIMILRVNIDQAEYWDSPSSLLSRAYAYVRAVTTGERSESDDVNEHAQVRP